MYEVPLSVSFFGFGIGTMRLLIDHVWPSIECVCCSCGPSQRPDAPSICFVCVFVCRKLFVFLYVGSYLLI